MPENEYMNSAESAALANPALRQQAKAISELSRIAVVSGMDDGRVGSAIETIRTLDKERARRVYKNLVKAGNLMEQIIPVIETVDIAQTDEPQPLIEEQVIDVTPVESIVEPTLNVPPVKEERNATNALSARAQKFVAEIFGEAVAEKLSLTSDDNAVIIDTLISLRDGKYDKAATKERLEGLFAGLSDAQIADHNGLTRNNVSMTFTALRRGIKQKEGYAPEEATRLLEEALDRGDTDPYDKQLEFIRNAAFEVDEDNRDEWLAIAEAHILSEMTTYVDEHSARTVWKYLHFNTHAILPEDDLVLEKPLTVLKSSLFRYGEKIFVRESHDEVAIRMLLIKEKRYNMLEDIYEVIHSRDTSFTRAALERRLVAGVAELLNERK